MVRRVLLALSMQEGWGRIGWASDWGKNIYAPSDFLGIANSDEVREHTVRTQFTAPDGSSVDKTWKVTIKYAATVDLAALNRYMDGADPEEDVPRSAIQVLEVVMRSGVSGESAATQHREGKGGGAGPHCTVSTGVCTRCRRMLFWDRTVCSRSTGSSVQTAAVRLVVGFTRRTTSLTAAVCISTYAPGSCTFALFAWCPFALVFMSHATADAPGLCHSCARNVVVGSQQPVIQHSSTREMKQAG